MSGEQDEPIVIKDEKEDDSDCEIVGSTSCLIDIPDYIDPSALSELISEPNEHLPPVVEKIVNKLTNDEEFDRECDKYYKANLDMDVEVVQVDVAKVLSEPIKLPTPTPKINLSAEIDDIRTCRDLPGICTLCEDSEDHVELLLNHFRDNHHLKQGLYVCPFCDYTSLKYEVVMKHTTKVHKLVSERHNCDQCDFQTFRGDLYNRHLNQHLKEKIYSCDQCNYKTINLANYKRHLNSKHTKEEEFKCNFCDFTSNNQGSVKKHENVKHNTEKMYACEKCPYKTPLPNTLKRHQERYCRNRNKRDTKAYTYVCIDCSFKTEDISALEDHTLMTHPKKEILFCNICDYSTTESAELTQHAQTHMKCEPLDNPK